MTPPDADRPQSVLATARQRLAEQRAIAVFASDPVKQARAGTLKHFQADRNAALPDQQNLIQQSIDEHYFHAALMAVSETPDDPAFIWTLAHDHRWMGLDVPGSRFGQDNSDNCYRLAAVAPSRRYRVSGRFSARPSCDFSISALSGQPGEGILADTTAVITRNEIDIGSDGEFEIAVDAEATGWRRNHLSIAGAKMLFVRDTLADWTAEDPAALNIRCLDPAESASFDAVPTAHRAAELGDRIARHMLEALQHGIFERGPLNTLNAPWAAGANGGLPTQASSLGHYRLNADQALVITADPLGADYVGMQITDIWMLSYEYRTRSSSLNHAQVVPDDDGRFRWVISTRDPGAPNWLDGGGIGCGTILLRWQGLGELPAADAVRCELVSFDEVWGRLPSSARRVDPEGRRRAAARRLAAYERRIR